MAVGFSALLEHERCYSFFFYELYKNEIVTQILHNRKQASYLAGVMSD